MLFFYEILIYHKIFEKLTYHYTELLNYGHIVIVFVKTKKYRGVILQQVEKPIFKTRELTILPFLLTSNYLKFLEQAAYFNLLPSNIFLNHLEYFSLRYKKIEYQIKLNPIQLTEEQNIVKQNMIDDVNLLFGVTGSGKTEVFFSIIQDFITQNQDGQLLILMPEIALTESIALRFEKTFGFKPFIWNSKNKSKNLFMNIFYGNIKILIGSRSAIWLPFPNLKIIVVDEEHDSSYKQNTYPTYNCRDMAILRFKISS